MGDSAQGRVRRTFLVVVDESEEMRAALRYACRRARRTGGQVALLRIIQPREIQHYALIGESMADELRYQASSHLNEIATDVQHISGTAPVLLICEGESSEELLKLLRDKPNISVLVLAAGTGADGPGPLVSALTGRLAHLVRIPVTIVPGAMTDDAIDAMT
ncbi:universal stress protein [Haematospirillum jordaniae]|uniref:Universal stress protein n=1 Tax=Haematospirillum jordaniae TaxID=1549855 RepID=A0A143DCK8_9PROT|nr:universal stress protein [Haematospirillum jordaniae]AMW34339.1 universal stress protein [Haematospirillum jordaniae]NKD44693.1 universal stress protein [Haematospirillum jordaniae]NKD57713.1 universal stress protein [Haematospirillum jordaniae]NKD59283.1 universal stress protein [Haematospirillum jordaniae]NKD67421.1 universal stress protein [Haematospirillum jordaniae]